MPPFHFLDDHPTLGLERDVALIQLLDKLNYDEVWVGEHHSTGVEIIASPELLIANAAPHTRHIRMGTGVNSLCFHHPFILAERIVQLDHLTRGRIMFGIGPGQLPGDAYMLGISPADQRRMMGEAVEAIVPLLRGETVSMTTDWFRLQDARLQLMPYQSQMEMASATALSTNGPTLAGKHGLGMLALAAGSPAGFVLLKQHWKVYAETSAKHGNAPDRNRWRVVASVHLAETREQALREVHHGIMDGVNYYKTIFGTAGTRDMGMDVHTAEEAVRLWTDHDGPGLGAYGIGIIGTVEDAITGIQRLQEETGGFGCFLMFAHNAASWEASQRSLELFARKVVPAIRGTNRSRLASSKWTAEFSERTNPVHTAGGDTARAIFAGGRK
jgi:limonene 1,2-monooxygenase